MFLHIQRKHNIRNIIRVVRKTDLYPQPLTQSDCEGRPTYQQDLEELTLLVAFEDQSVQVFSLKEHTLPLLVHFFSLSPQVDT